MDEKAPFKASGSKACKAGFGTKASRLRLGAHQPHPGAGAKTQLLAPSPKADAQTAQRVCKVCGQEQPMRAFHPNGKGGWRWQCRECEKQRNYAWRKANPERWKELQRRLSKKRSEKLPTVSREPTAEEIASAGSTRTCRQCGKHKELHEFDFLPVVRHWRWTCIACRNVKQLVYNNANLERHRRQARESWKRRHPAKWPKGKWPRPPVGDRKVCAHCKVDKPISEFKMLKNGRPGWCKECMKATLREHYQNNKEYYRLKCQVRQNRRRSNNAVGIDKLTPARWLQLCANVDTRCVYCGSAGDLTMDHIIPVVEGGTNHWKNYVPACLSCNMQRHTKAFVEFCDMKHVDPFAVLLKVRGDLQCL